MTIQEQTQAEIERLILSMRTCGMAFIIQQANKNVAFYNSEEYRKREEQIARHEAWLDTLTKKEREHYAKEEWRRNHQSEREFLEEERNA